MLPPPRRASQLRQERRSTPRCRAAHIDAARHSACAKTRRGFDIGQARPFSPSPSHLVGHRCRSHAYAYRPQQRTQRSLSAAVRPWEQSRLARGPASRVRHSGNRRFFGLACRRGCGDGGGPIAHHREGGEKLVCSVAAAAAAALISALSLSRCARGSWRLRSRCSYRLPASGMCDRGYSRPYRRGWLADVP
jgi:hypothetical protein